MVLPTGRESFPFSDNAEAIRLLSAPIGCDALSPLFRLTEKVSESFRIPDTIWEKKSLSREEQIVADMMDSVKEVTFDWSTVRVSNAQISASEIDAKAQMSTATIAAMQKSIDKMILNSVFGKSPNSIPSWTNQVFPEAQYTATILKVETGDLVHRVKIRCPNWEQTGPSFPSESHACEDFAARVVKPWVEENCAHQTMHMNYAVFAFESETDATLCYMRFK